MAAQAGLCLGWSETPEDTFSHVVAQMKTGISLMPFYWNKTYLMEYELHIMYMPWKFQYDRSTKRLNFVIPFLNFKSHKKVQYNKTNHRFVSKLISMWFHWVHFVVTDRHHGKCEI